MYSISFGLKLREKISKQELVIGSWLLSYSPDLAEIMAHNGYDFLVIDLEHSSISISQAAILIKIIQGAGIGAFVRLSGIDKAQASRMLDAGVNGLIVPNIRTRAEIEEVVSWTKFAPSGGRGAGFYRSCAHGNRFHEHFSEAAGSITVIPQIENLEGVEEFESIISCPDVLTYMIGPYDLSCALGVPGEFSSPIYRDVLSKLSEIAEKHEVSSGLHVVSSSKQDLLAAISDGSKFLVFGVDTLFINESTSLTNLELRR